jgi:hypothetical protein
VRDTVILCILFLLRVSPINQRIAVLSRSSVKCYCFAIVDASVLLLSINNPCTLQYKTILSSAPTSLAAAAPAINNFVGCKTKCQCFGAPNHNHCIWSRVHRDTHSQRPTRTPTALHTHRHHQSIATLAVRSIALHVDIRRAPCSADGCPRQAGRRSGGI